MESSALIPVQYGFDTFYFLICGALVMWMAAGFAMLESGLVRAKNTAEILTKNIVLYSVASIMYLLVGYYIMYSSPEGGILPSLGFLIGDENAVDVVAAGGEDAPYYAARADFFFQIVFAATAMSVVSGAVAERMKLWAFIAFAGVNLAAFMRYWVRSSERRVSNFVLPLLGALICLYLWLSLRLPAKVAGGVWLAAGVLYGAIRTRGFRRQLSFEAPPE